MHNHAKETIMKIILFGSTYGGKWLLHVCFWTSLPRECHLRDASQLAVGPQLHNNLRQH